MLSALAAALAGTGSYNKPAEIQFFALLSTDGGYSALTAALPGGVEYGTADHDANLKIWASPVTNAEINRTSALSSLREDNYPNALCRHRWTSFEEFRAVGGFHMLGESVRSTEGIASRPGIHFARVSSGNADGSTRYDAYGWDDISEFATTSTYFCHDIMYRTVTSGINAADQVNVATGGAATDAASTNFRGDAGLTPALFLEAQYFNAGASVNYDNTDLDWEPVPNLVAAGCYIKSTFKNWAQTNVIINAPSRVYDTAQANPKKNATALAEDCQLTKVATLAECSDELTFYIHNSQNCFSSPYGAPDSALQDDGGALTDYTAEAASAGGADVIMFPGTAATGDQFIVGHDEIFSAVKIGISTAGVGDYVLTPKYWNGSTLATLSTGIWAPSAATGWKSATGVAGQDPIFVFNPPDDWVANDENSEGTKYRIYFEYTSGTMSTSPVADDLVVGATFAVVHLKDDADPNDAPVIAGGPGLHIGYRRSTRVGQVQLINMSYIDPDGPIAQLTGSNLMPTILRMKGGRYIESGHWFQNGTCDEWYHGAADDRAPPWDTSDRIDSRLTEGVARIVLKWGTDPSTLTAAKIAQFPHFLHQNVGPHYSQATSGGSSPGAPTYMPIDGIFIDQTGLDHKGITRSTDPDKHSLAIRGSYAGTTTIWNRVISRDGHAHIHPYLVTDTDSAMPITGGNNSLGPLTLKDSVIFGLGPSDNTAGLFGVRVSGNGANVLRDNGQGDVDFTLQAVAIMDIDRSNPLPVADGAGLIWGCTQSPNIQGVSFIRCLKGIQTTHGGPEERLYVVVEDSGTGFTNQTTNNYNATTFDAFPATPAVGDRIWFGRKRSTFRKARPNIITSGVGSGLTGKWRYLNGDTVTDLPTSGTYSDGTTGFTAATGDRTLEFDRPTLANWAAGDLSGNLPVEGYWICYEITAGTYTTVPQITSTDGPRTGNYNVHEEADKMEFLDSSGCWIEIGGLNTSYESDARTTIIDNVTGRLNPGETIATQDIVWRQTSFGHQGFTLAEIQAGGLDKDYATTDAWEESVGRFLANVSSTPGVDIEEVP